MTEARRTVGPLRRIAAAAAAVGAAGACLGSLACTRSAPARRLVAATVFPVFDLTRRVADDRLHVRLLLAPRPAPHLDPHSWTAPVRAQRAVDVIVEALSGLDPEGGPFYRERGGTLKRSIQAVHADVARQAETWPRRRLVTFHGSLFYFAARYGLQVVGVVQTVPGTEPTAQP